jgi:hypothetical protein
VDEIQREIAVLAQCRSPHVTRYIGACPLVFIARGRRV